MPLDGGEPRKCSRDLPLGVFDPRGCPTARASCSARMLFKGHLTARGDRRPRSSAASKDPVKAHVTEDRFYRFWDTWLTTGEVPHLFLLRPRERRRCATSRPNRRCGSTGWIRAASSTSRPTARRSCSPAIAWDEPRLDRCAPRSTPCRPWRGRGDVPHARPSGDDLRAALHARRQGDRLRHAARPRLLRRPRAPDVATTAHAKTHTPICPRTGIARRRTGSSRTTARCSRSRPRMRGARRAVRRGGRGPEPQALVRGGSISGLAAGGRRGVLQRCRRWPHRPKLHMCSRRRRPITRAHPLHRRRHERHRDSARCARCSSKARYGESGPDVRRAAARIRSGRALSAGPGDPRRAARHQRRRRSTCAGTRSCSPRPATSSRW